MFGQLSQEEESHFASINKTWILSAGRTGTRFLGEKLDELLTSSISTHEPDRIKLHLVDDLKYKLRQQGFQRLILGKALGAFGTRNLSLRRITGQLSSRVALERLLLERQWVLAKRPTTYIESNSQLFGLGNDLIALPKSRVVVLVRDPRNWLVSWLAKDWFSETDWMDKLGVLGFKRLSPSMVGEEVDWGRWTRLQKLAWTWNNINQRLLDLYHGHPENVRLYRFEAVFEERDPAAIESILGFLSWDMAAKQHKEIFLNMLDQKINASRSGSITEHQPFTIAENQWLEKTCGRVARELGYNI